MRFSDKPFFIITGAGRSGTSFLSRALNLSGTYLGEKERMSDNEYEAHESNPLGHWENSDILDLTEKTLAFNNGSYYNPPEQIVITEELGRKIRETTEELNRHPSFASGFKDPRMCVLLESWASHLPKNLIIIGIFRHPLKFAESLKTRDSYDYDKSLNLWRKYNDKLLHLLDNYTGFLLDYDWPTEKLFEEIYLILDKAGLPKISLSEWFRPELRRSDKTYLSDYPLPHEISVLHSKLKDRSSKNAAIMIPKAKYNNEELYQIAMNLLVEIKNQSNFFKQVYDKNLEKNQK